MWDLKFTPLNIPPSYPISAVYMNTEPEQTAPWVMPGKYMVRLTVDDKIMEQTFTVKLDPRVKISLPELQKQHDLSLQSYQARNKCVETLKEIKSFRSRLQSQLTNAEQGVAAKLGPIEKAAGLLENASNGKTETNFERLSNVLATIFNTLQESDRPPTTQVMEALSEAQQQLNELSNKWNEIKNKVAK
jgi:hypothetical protein